MLQSADNVDVEIELAKGTLRRVLVVAPVVVGVLALIWGVDGAIAAAVGVGVVVANFAVTGWILSMAARISLAAYHAAALFGFFLRFALLAALMLVVVRFFELHRPAFAIAAVGSYFVLLALQVSAVTRGKERQLEWTS